MIKLGGNEKFGLREGWLSKGLKIVEQSSINPFLDENAIVKFGIGANMIKALRYYLKISRMIIETKNKCELNKETGIDILMKKDPYFEDDFCYFIFHYLVVSNIKIKTVSSVLFNGIESEIFSKSDVIDIVKKEAAVSNESISEKTLENDVNIVLSMYAKEKRDDDVEDAYVSPLVNLKLIKKIDTNIYKKTSENIKCLSEYLVYYCIENCIEEREEGINLNDMINRYNSPNKVFNLSRDQINIYIDLLRKKGLLKFESTAGLNMIYLKDKIYLRDVIEEYYQ